MKKIRNIIIVILSFLLVFLPDFKKTNDYFLKNNDQENTVFAQDLELPEESVVVESGEEFQTLKKGQLFSIKVDAENNEFSYTQKNGAEVKKNFSKTYIHAKAINGNWGLHFTGSNSKETPLYFVLEGTSLSQTKEAALPSIKVDPGINLVIVLRGLNKFFSLFGELPIILFGSSDEELDNDSIGSILITSDSGGVLEINFANNDVVANKKIGLIGSQADSKYPNFKVTIGGSAIVRCTSNTKDSNIFLGGIYENAEVCKFDLTIKENASVYASFEYSSEGFCIGAVSKGTSFVNISIEDDADVVIITHKSSIISLGNEDSSNYSFSVKGNSRVIFMCDSVYDFFVKKNSKIDIFFKENCSVLLLVSDSVLQLPSASSYLPTYMLETYNFTDGINSLFPLYVPTKLNSKELKEDSIVSLTLTNNQTRSAKTFNAEMRGFIKVYDEFKGNQAEGSVENSHDFSNKISTLAAVMWVPYGNYNNITFGDIKDAYAKVENKFEFWQKDPATLSNLVFHSNHVKASVDTANFPDWINQDPTISGKGEPGYTIVITKEDGSYCGQTTVNKDGTWEITLSNANEGENQNYTVTQSNNNNILDVVNFVISVDKKGPSGEIRVEKNSWNYFLNTISAGFGFKEKIDVKILAEDTLSGIKKIEYIKTDQHFQDAQDLIVNYSEDKWINLSSSIKQSNDGFLAEFGVNPDESEWDPALLNKVYFIYAKITDNALNATYISSDKLILYKDSNQEVGEIAIQEGSSLDVNLSIELRGKSVVKIVNKNLTSSGNSEGTELNKDIDYVFNENGTITFKGECLKNLTQGTYYIDVYSDLPDKVSGDVTLIHKVKLIVNTSQIVSEVSINNLSAFSTWINDSPTISGKGEPGYEIRVAKDGSSTFDSVIVGDDGTFSLTLSNVEEGENQIFNVSQYNGETFHSKTFLEISMDKTGPAGKIEVGNNSFTEFLNRTIKSIGFKDKIDVTISVVDSLSGIDSVEYLISTEQYETIGKLIEKSENKWKIVRENLENVNFSITPDESWNSSQLNKEFFVYAKIVDKAQNVLYLSSDGLILYRDSIKATSEVVVDKILPKDASVVMSLGGKNVIKVVNMNEAIKTNDESIVFGGSDANVVSAAEEVIRKIRANVPDLTVRGELVKERDYVIEDNKIIFKKEYFKNLEPGEYYFYVFGSLSNVSDTENDLVILHRIKILISRNVMTSKPNLKAIAELDFQENGSENDDNKKIDQDNSNAIFVDNSEKNDVTVDVELDINTIEKVVNNTMNDVLNFGRDYSTSSGKIVFSSEYISKLPNGVHDIDVFYKDSKTGEIKVKKLKIVINNSFSNFYRVVIKKIESHENLHIETFGIIKNLGLQNLKDFSAYEITFVDSNNNPIHPKEIGKESISIRLQLPDFFLKDGLHSHIFVSDLSESFVGHVETVNGVHYLEFEIKDSKSFCHIISRELDFWS
ncbi:MAG: Ig-like domain-containing protein [Oscillospiraceae bacterium]|jgi:hypothetical protein|nr:Ig-like domain-containing protein [Oscillospiraceae bacterium]